MGKKKKKSALREWSGIIHLWLGLASGIVMFIVAVTGCIFVFHNEIKDVVYDWRLIPAEDKSFVSPSLLQEKVRDEYPGAGAEMVVYQGPERSAFVYSSMGEGYYHVYFNPYSGEQLHMEELGESFFDIVEEIHINLLLPDRIGNQVVGISTIIFIITLITGIVLWWPKKRKHLRKGLTIKFNARWRRVNYDLHNVTGFYTSVLGLLIAVTGLAFSYEWVHDAIYTAGNLGKEYPGELSMPEVESEETPERQVPAVDLAMERTFEILPESGMFFVWELGEDSPVITGAYPKALHFDHQSNFFFHPETGEQLGAQLYEDKSTGLQLQEMNYGIHSGQYFGLAGQIVAFLVSLVVAGLPVTGFLIWWGKRKKKQKEAGQAS